MKKLFALSLVLAVCFLTGCGVSQKKYSSVDEYELAMKEVQKKYPSLMLEGIAHQKDKPDVNFTAYLKNGNWREHFILNDKKVMVISNKEGTCMKSSSSCKRMKLSSAIRPLTEWNNSAGSKNSVLDKKFVGTKKINGMDCRMIQYTGKNMKIGNQILDNVEINSCVLDKYGIAIYSDFTAQSDGKEFKKSLELKKIENIELPDSIFELK